PRTGVRWLVSPIGGRLRPWHPGGVPAVDTVLLPLCVGLTLLGVIITGLAWRRGSRGRVVQGVGLALAPVALYFSGLLRLVWNGVVAVGDWAGNVIGSPTVWVGLAVLALCVVLWVVGGILVRRTPKSPKKSKQQSALGAADRSALPATGTQAGRGRATPATNKTAPAKATPPVDDDMAEIEALLKSRGIE
ncbi:MAG: hypothetical protein JWP61_1227, partial [Friedmanniella sp.]|nr:hypothetical protein [Friedmanniella sp.]